MAYNKKNSKFVAVGKEQVESADHRQVLTDRLLETMENAGKWEKPWFVCPNIPRNAITGENYRGVNIISLMSAGYDNENFGTFVQWGTLEKTRQAAQKDLIGLQSGFQSGSIPADKYIRDKAKIEAVFEELESKGMIDRGKPIHVKKGEKGIAIFKAIDITVLDKNGDGAAEDIDAEPGTKKIKSMVHAGTVFNVSQIANMQAPQGRSYDFEPHAEADLHIQAMTAKTGLKLEHNSGGRAYYSVNEHKVVMPNKDKFVPGAYYDTLMHELGHSTGPALGRDLTGSFGSTKYAFEELIAELTSVFMSAELGIPHNTSTHENHAAYMKSWATAMKADKNMIFKAASKAQQSADYQNFVRNEYKLENGLSKENGNEQQKIPAYIADKLPVQKKEKQLAISM